MKRVVYALVVICSAFSYKALANNSGFSSSNKNCGENGFSTEVINAELKENGCIDYTLKVTYDAKKCAHALSHYTVAVSCGKISQVSNSENWKLEYGYDKKTGLYGFKVDNIPNFGETDLESFTVSFTVCQDGNQKCSTKEGCCYPIVAYKAGTCVYYEKLKDSCPSPEPDPTELKATIEKNDASCYGSSDGSLAVTVTEGKEPYSYSWSNGSTTPSISELPPGTYKVVVKDDSGKELILEETISEAAQIVILGDVNNESCGNKNGSVDLNVSGGSGGYTFVWSNDEATTEDLNSLAAGVYSVIVKDDKGCTAEASFDVINQSSLIVTAVPTFSACGQANGAIDITVSGGTGPYTYQWSNGATTQDIQNLGPGTYRVTITDINGCTAESAYAIKENNSLKLTFAVTQTSCLEDGSGAIDLMVQGGTPSYTYAWSNGATTQDISGLTAGFYTVIVTDAAGCVSTLRISVTKKTFQVSEQVVQPACNNSQGGSVTLNPLGGVSPYTYDWSNGATTNTVMGLTPGIYTVKVTDATGCSRDLAYVISDPTGISSSASVTNDACNADGNFNIDITVSGGQGPYQYQWSNGATTEDLTGIDAGSYTVIITDVNGCSTTREIEVVGGSTWTCLINQPETDVICSSTGNTLNTSVDGESYSWSMESSDGQWAIVEGSQGSSIVYTSGGPNSSATFILTVVKDGCTQTCEYTVTTCKDNDQTDPPDDPNDDSDNDGDDEDNGDDGDDGNDNGDDDGSGDNDGDDGNDDNGGDDSGDDDGSDDNDGDDGNPDGSCEDCFDSQIVKESSDGNCRTYEVKVLTDGSCHHGLSHWTIAIPCGIVKNYSNSENWKMELGTDPTTGLFGLKVDDIQGFGGSNDYFTVRFTICSDKSSCSEKLNSWDPVVAYKSGQCISYDELELNDDHYGDNDGPVCTVYPNPFREKLVFEWQADDDEEASLEIFDSKGHHVKDIYRGKVYKGEHYRVECTDLEGSMYIYRFRSGKKTKHGKLCKSR